LGPNSQRAGVCNGLYRNRSTNALTIFVVLLKVLIKLFQKFAVSKGGALVAPAGAKLFFRHFLFAKLFLLCLLPQKKKRYKGKLILDTKTF
jgi:hypothetical protein